MTRTAREAGPPVPAAAGRSRSWRGIAIVGLIAALGALTLVTLNQPERTDSRFAVLEQIADPPTASSDPLTAQLTRCRTLTPGRDDPACRAAWEESRRRFFGGTRATPDYRELLPTDAPAAAPRATTTATER